MNCLKYALLFSFTFLSFGIFGQEVPQKSWRKLMSEAEEFEMLGDLSRAAIYYEAAYKQKEERKDLIYRAGNFYLETRDYNKAAKCLEEVKNFDQDSIIKIPGFKYASALKQLGRYQEAKEAFSEYILIYKGSDKEKMQTLTDLEILGCDFALKNQEYTNKEIKVKHLGEGINSERT